MKKGTENWLCLVVIILAWWVFVSQFVFAVRHPHLTGTERLLNFHKAVLLRSLDDEK